MEQQILPILIDIQRQVGLLTGELGTMKITHDENRKDIKTINERTYNLDSWKNRLEQHITDEKEMAILEVNKRLKPLEDTYKDIKDFKFDKDKMLLESRLSLREKVIVGVIAIFPTLATWIITK